MANPRQRRKARSSSHHPVSHSRRAKKILKKTPPIRGPKVLQDAWDKRKTVRQNYAALGLVHSLDPLLSGGVELSESSSKTAITHPSASASSSSSNPTTKVATAPSTAPSSVVAGPSTTTTVNTEKNGVIPKGHGRIIRDEEGKIVRVELAVDEGEHGPDEETKGDGDVTMEDLEPQVDEDTKAKWIEGMGGRLEGSAPSVVSALERIASSAKGGKTTVSATLSGVGPRHASAGEVAYMKRLVAKYGQDLDKMARDRKLNSEQRTAAQLRKSLIRCGLVGS